MRGDARLGEAPGPWQVRSDPGSRVMMGSVRRLGRTDFRAGERVAGRGTSREGVVRTAPSGGCVGG
jgi:hypothetical protein